MAKATMIPGAGLKNWKSNLYTAAKVVRADGPKGREAGMFGGVFNREHFDGQVDGRVGGSFVDAETEERWRKGLVVVQGIAPMTLAELEAAMLVAKKKFYAHRKDPKARAAFRELKYMLQGARSAARRQDPRRLAALGD
jgi:hypothetical protein